MRAPVRSAPAPPGLRTAGTVASRQPASIIKRPVSGMVQRHGSIGGVSVASGAPLRPVRSTNHHQSGGGRSASIPSNVALLASLTPVPVAPPSAAARRNTASTGKKRAPPRPPPPKLKVRDTPPTYEDVLREDAASLVDFMFTPPAASPRAADSKRGRAASATPARTNGAGDLIDFMTPAKPLPAPSPTPPTPSAPAVAATWDDTPPAPTRAGGSTFFGIDSSGSGGGVFKVPTVIRPTKPSVATMTSSGGASAGRSAVAVSRSMSDLSAVRGREESPPMPTMPPPPPPSAVDPDPYCRPPTPPPRPSSSASCPETPMAIALYDYRSAEPDDLSFRADDSIRLLEQVNAEWMRGATAGRQGMFPAAYVHVTVPLPQQLTASEQGDIYCSEEAVAGDGGATYIDEVSAASGGDGVATFSEGGVRVMAQYDFNATEEQDLSFQAGDQVLVVGKLNDEWGYGSRHTVHYGQFPLSYVDVDPAILPLL